MEIIHLSDDSVKIRGKQSSLVVNPLNIRSKITAQSAVFFHKLEMPLEMKYFEESPVLIQGPGEYEVSGMKITGNKAGEGYIYQAEIDGIDILIAKTSLLAKAKESVTEYQIVVLSADSLVDQSVLTALNPNVIVFFGEKKTENAKALGKEESPISKYSVTRDKLPTDTQIVIL